MRRIRETIVAVLKQIIITCSECVSTDDLRKKDYEENIWPYKTKRWLLED